jgi:hypothetical protein
MKTRLSRFPSEPGFQLPFFSLLLILPIIWWVFWFLQTQTQGPLSATESLGSLNLIIGSIAGLLFVLIFYSGPKGAHHENKDWGYPALAIGMLCWVGQAMLTLDYFPGELSKIVDNAARLPVYAEALLAKNLTEFANGHHLSEVELQKAVMGLRAYIATIHTEPDQFVDQVRESKRTADCVKAILSIVNSSAFLFAVRYLDYMGNLKPKTRLTREVLRFNQWIQQHITFSRIFLITFIAILATYILYLQYPNDLKYIYRADKVWSTIVLVVLSCGLSQIFMERELEKVNVMILALLALTMYGEWSKGGSAELGPVINAIYKTSLALIFISMAVSYKVYQKILELQNQSNPEVNNLGFFFKHIEMIRQRLRVEPQGEQALHHNEAIRRQLLDGVGRLLSYDGADDLMGNFDEPDRPAVKELLHEFAKNIYRGQLSVLVLGVLAWLVVRKQGLSPRADRVEEGAFARKLVELARSYQSGASRLNQPLNDKQEWDVFSELTLSAYNFLYSLFMHKNRRESTLSRVEFAEDGSQVNFVLAIQPEPLIAKINRKISESYSSLFYVEGDTTQNYFLLRKYFNMTVGNLTVGAPGRIRLKGEHNYLILEFQL